MSGLRAENYEDLLTYHMALKQFLNTSIAQAKMNPTRAAKARDKLLKLSPSQFFELSTDVYDELQRRIDESSDEPDFLLPRSTFHPKRNEAREKLGSLQQTRFRDLVSDILYEIERRKYNRKVSSSSSPLSSSPLPPPSSSSSSDSSSSEAHQKMKLDNVNGNHESISLDKKQGGVVSVQSTEVIPKEADMAWSDSENEDHQDATEEKIDQNKIVEDVTMNSLDSTGERISYRSKEFSSSSERYSYNKTNSIPSTISLKKKSSQKSNRSIDDKDILESNMIGNSKHSSGQVSIGLSVINKNRNKDREIEVLLKEGTKMDNTINNLEQTNSLLHSKAEMFEAEIQDLQRINDDLHQRILGLEQELDRKDKVIESLHNELQIESNKSNSKNQEIGLLTTNPKKLDVTTPVDTTTTVVSMSYNDVEVENMKKEVAELKSNLENFKSKKIDELLSLSADLNKPYRNCISKTGVVPITLFESFRDSIQKFLIHINENAKFKEVDTNKTFDHISKVSNAASKIASYSHHSEKAELIRASVSHSITSTRYYAIYGSMLPLLVIESAISEVVFAVYEFISDVQLNPEKDELNEDEQLKNSPSSKTASPFNNDTSRSFYIDTADTGIVDTNDMKDSPVRPLRMTMNINSPHNSSTSTRKTKLEDSATNSKTFNTTMDSQLINQGAVRTDEIPSTHHSDKMKTINHEKESSFTSPIPLKTDFSVLAPKYSPESEKRLSNDSIGTDKSSATLKKSSLGNVLQNVRQFEQQDSTSPISKKSIVSPLSEKIMNKHGKKISSLENSFESNNDVLSQKPTPKLEDELDLNNNHDNFKYSQRHKNGRVTSDVDSEKTNDTNIDQGLKPFNIRKRGLKAIDLSKTVPTFSDTVTATTDKKNSSDNFKSSLNDDLRQFNQKNADNSLTTNPNQFDENKVSDEYSNDADDSKFDLTSLKNEIKINGGKIENNDDSNLAEAEIPQKFREYESREPQNTLNVLDAKIKERSTERRSNLTKKSTVVKRIPLEVEDEDDYEEEEEDFNKTPEIKKENQESKDTTPYHSDNEKEEILQQKSYTRPIRKEVHEEDFDVEEFDIDDPGNTLSELLLYLEHQTVKVISTIQILLTSIKDSNSTRGDLKNGSRAINDVVVQMVGATFVSMNQSRNAQLKAHGSWVVETLSDAGKRMDILINRAADQTSDEEYADKHFRQRLAGIAFDVAKCTKELVKTVEEANLNEEIEHLNKKLVQ